MVTLIHGDDITSSRKFLIEQKESTKDIESFDGDKVTATDLVQVIEGGSLFGSNKTIFIENLLSKKSGKDLENIKNYIKSHSFFPITLWEGKEIAKPAILFFGKINQQLFKIPKNIFLFLDNIKPGFGKNLVIEFHKNLKTNDADFIFQMIIRQIRLLLAISEDSGKNIEEIARLQNWQRTKLIKQSSLFTKEKLIQLHSSLCEIDLGIKTGRLNLSPEQSIDIFLLEI